VLRLAHWVAQVCNADARDHRRVAKDGGRDGEVVEESNTGAKKNRRDVDVDPSRRQAFSNCWMVSAPWTATDFSGAAALAWFTALSMPSVTNCTVELGRGHPAGMSWVSTNAGPPIIISIPVTGDVESTSTGEHGTKLHTQETTDGPYVTARRCLGFTLDDPPRTASTVCAGIGRPPVSEP
jgi:hypothetical protein